MNTAETTVMKTVATYAIELRTWLKAQGIAENLETHPLVGRWQLGSGQGLMEFTDKSFAWHRSADGSSQDLMSGDYNVLPGAQTNAGFIIDRGRKSTSCFSVMQHYTFERVDGVASQVDRYGALFIEQADSVDQIIIFNHRTGARFTGRRVSLETPQ